MNTTFGLDSTPVPAGGCVLTVGNFDGVHRAHQRLLAVARQRANDHRIAAVVLTFEPHPLTVVAPQRAPQRLTSAKEKLRLLDMYGVDEVVVAESTPQLLAMEAEEFIADVLVARFAPRHLVEGPSFGFGRGRRGDNALLARQGTKLGFSVEVVDPVLLIDEGGREEMVSSSMIRAALRAGRVERAWEALNRPYAICGPVIRGQGRGAGLGFPTANLKITDQLVPAEGVYAGLARWGSHTSSAAVSIGSTPTFGSGSLQVEAHLLGTAATLYDMDLRLELHRRLRGQVRFESPAALKCQIEEDVRQVRAQFMGGNPGGDVFASLAAPPAGKKDTGR